MNKLHDPELELFKRTVDLADYAKRAGYELRPQDGAPGLTVLDHPNRDRIVVGQHPNGLWVYASVPDYMLRAPSEPAEQALARLRSAIDRSQDKGTVVEFVQQRDPVARRGDVPLDQVRDRLRNFRATSRPLDFEAALRPPLYASGHERSADPPRDGPRPDAQVAPGEVVARRSNPELNQRRYDWSPPIPNAPRETEVEQRLRRWREAQAAIDLKVRGPREVATPARSPASAAMPPLAPDAKAPSLPDRPPTDRNETPGQKKNSELNRRRYDWTPAPAGVDALVRGARNRSPDRGR